MTLLGGEAYITFKPDLIDDHGNIADESTKKFLQGFVDRFATLVERRVGEGRSGGSERRLTADLTSPPARGRWRRRRCARLRPGRPAASD